MFHPVSRLLKLSVSWIELTQTHLSFYVSLLKNDTTIHVTVWAILNSKIIFHLGSFSPLLPKFNHRPHSFQSPDISWVHSFLFKLDNVTWIKDWIIYFEGSRYCLPTSTCFQSPHFPGHPSACGQSDLSHISIWAKLCRHPITEFFSRQTCKLSNWHRHLMGLHNVGWIHE